MDFIQVRNTEQLAKEIVSYIESVYLISIKDKGSFTFVLSGGTTPKFVFDELIENYKDKIDWKKVHIFWLDERCVSPDHIDSNYKLAYDHLLNYLEVGSVHRIQGEIDPQEAAKLYEEDIIRFFKLKEDDIPSFDLILLGMGEDGHCASLFPDSSELKERKSLVISTQKEYNGHKRVTLTLPIINKSNKILMIGSQEKLDVFNDRKRVLPIHLVKSENMKVITKHKKDAE